MDKLIAQIMLRNGVNAVAYSLSFCEETQQMVCQFFVHLRYHPQPWAYSAEVNPHCLEESLGEFANEMRRLFCREILECSVSEL